MPIWKWLLLVALGLGAVAALWWAIRSSEPAAWAIFFSLLSMNISVSGWAWRTSRAKKDQTPGS